MPRATLLCAALLVAALPAAADEADDIAREASFGEAVAAYDAGDYARAFDLWLPLAQEGDLAAMRNVGQLLRLGRGVEKDLPRAFDFYSRAAEKGFVTAQVNLAFMYLNGEGVEKNAKEAAVWFDRAARAGQPLAQYNLAVLYETGNGVETDMARALGWYALAAQLGHDDALRRLSELVVDLPGPDDTGDEVDRAPEQAAAEAETAPEESAPEKEAVAPAGSENPPPAASVAAEPAKKGGLAPGTPPVPDMTAEAPQPDISPNGLAVTPDQASRYIDANEAYQAGRHTEAQKGFEALAYEGVAEAQYKLGRMRNRGEAGPRDPVAALAWWRIAADAGHQGAARAAAALESELGPTREDTAGREEEQFRSLIAETLAAKTTR